MAGYEEQGMKFSNDIAQKAESLKAFCLYPVLNDGGGFIKDAGKRVDALRSAVKKGSEINELQSAGVIAGAAANAIMEYARQYGEIPGDGLMASAWDNIFAAAKSVAKREFGLPQMGVFESADLGTTDGIVFLERMTAMMLPSMLKGITGRFINHIPVAGQVTEAAIFKFRRIAKTAFGEYAEGDEIGMGHSGPYGSMSKLVTVGNGNGTLTSFTHTPDPAAPCKPHSVKIMHNFLPVAMDDGEGKLTGSFKVGATDITVTGTVNYTNGVISPTFSTAPASSVKIDAEFDINIEKSPGLIPKVGMDVQKKVIRPHEFAIGASVTLQALWQTRREYKMDQISRLMMMMRNLIAADRDRQRLSRMYYFAQSQTGFSWNRSNASFNVGDFYYQGLQSKLNDISADMMGDTEVSGVHSVVFDKGTSALIKSFPPAHFTRAPGYRHEPQPHYIGRLFGEYDAYENPAADANKVLCIGKGPGVCESAFVAGDAVPPVPIKHPVGSSLAYDQTLWAMGHDNLNPFDGEKYLRLLTVTTS